MAKVFLKRLNYLIRIELCPWHSKANTGNAYAIHTGMCHYQTGSICILNYGLNPLQPGNVFLCSTVSVTWEREWTCCCDELWSSRLPVVWQGWFYRSYLLLLFMYVRLRQWFAWATQESKKLASMSSYWPFPLPRYSFCWLHGCRKMHFQCCVLQNFSGQCSFFSSSGCPSFALEALVTGGRDIDWLQPHFSSWALHLNLNGWFICLCLDPSYGVIVVTNAHYRHLFRGSALLSAAEIHAPVGHQIGQWVWVHSVLLPWLSVWKPHCLVWKPYCPSHLQNRMGMENPSDGILLNSGRSDKTPWQCQLGLDKSTW